MDDDRETLNGAARRCRSGQGRGSSGRSMYGDRGCDIDGEENWGAAAAVEPVVEKDWAQRRLERNEDHSLG